MPLSEYGTNLYTSVITRGADAPAAFYLALLSTLPNSEDDGTSIAAYEPVDDGYARVLVPVGTAWSIPIDGFSEYNTAISFTATEDWGTVLAFALCTEATGGQMLMYDYLAAPVQAQSGATVQIPANALSMGLVT